MSKCLRCKNTMTWAQQRQQFGRLLRAGLSPQESRDISPRCQKCVTLYLGSAARAARAAVNAVNAVIRGYHTQP